MIKIKSEYEIEKIKEAAKILSETHLKMQEAIVPRNINL